MSIRGKVLAEYLGSDDPERKFTDYYPEWLNQLADDVALEGSLIEGVVRGRESVRTVVLAIRSLYDRQEWYFAGEVGGNGFLEEYVGVVRGEPIGCVVLVRYNADGQVDQIAAGYRPRGSLLLLTRLLGEKFAGTSYAEFFVAS
jgi:hypothetical protein